MDQGEGAEAKGSAQSIKHSSLLPSLAMGTCLMLLMGTYHFTPLLSGWRWNSLDFRLFVIYLISLSSSQWKVWLDAWDLFEKGKNGKQQIHKHEETVLANLIPLWLAKLWAKHFGTTAPQSQCCTPQSTLHVLSTYLWNKWINPCSCLDFNTNGS